LAKAGRKLLELLGEVKVDLLRVTPKQLECLKMLEHGKKYTSDIPEKLRATLQNLVKRELVEKRITEEETTQKVYGKRLTYTITEKGAKAHKTLKTIEAL
jgi:DNA-binding HxlR family transcriptional regulator